MNDRLLRVVQREDGYHLQRRMLRSTEWESLCVFEGVTDDSLARAEEALFAELQETQDLNQTEPIPIIRIA